MNNVNKGKIGEAIATAYLQLHLYKIIQKNYREKTGEIDIIAEKDGYIIFIEVKYRKDLSKGYPREAVTPFKQRQIKRTALMYLIKNDLMNRDVRFDVIEIVGERLEHIKDAFW